MKKILLAVLSTAVLLTLGCKQGSVSGRVLDPMTGKPVTSPTVWIRGTTYKLQSPDGSFKFEKIKFGEYTLSAGKNKHSEYSQNVVLSEENPDVVQDIFLYSRDGITPGLFHAKPEGAEKWLNLWVNWEVACTDNSFAYRLKFTDAKTKKNLELPDPQKVTTDFVALYYQQSSVSRPFDAAAYPMVEAQVSTRPACSGFEKQRTGLFPDMSKGTPLKVTYKSDNMYEIQGSLPKGRQALMLSQDGKLLKAYLFQVQ